MSIQAVQLPYAGFPGQVWATCFQALAYLNNLMASGTTTIGAIANPVSLVYDLLRNSIESINAFQTGQALSIEVQNMTAIQALPINLDPVTTTFFNTRIASLTLAAEQISALQPVANPFTVVSQITAGVSGLVQSNYLSYCVSFSGEVPPVNLIPATLPAFATGVATAWQNVANAITLVQGNNPTQAFDTAVRQFRCATTVANVIGQLQSGPFAVQPASSLQALWSSVVALPTILLDGESQATSPSSLAAQQGLSIRFALRQIANQLALLLYAISTAVGSAPVTAILRNAETLLDLAARELGNFENWPQIVSANALQPPFPGPTNQNVALAGQQLYMPGSNVQIGANTTPPTYPNSVMGVDYNFGPINGSQPAWTGELPTLTGYLNFAAALGRRLQTPLGSLVYHRNYGSRIPPEVGAIQSLQEAQKLIVLASAAINADTRTGRILSVTGSVQPGFLATINAVVIPKGPSATPVSISTPISAISGA
jgi:hypothetical protein